MDQRNHGQAAPIEQVGESHAHRRVAESDQLCPLGGRVMEPISVARAPSAGQAVVEGRRRHPGLGRSPHRELRDPHRPPRQVKIQGWIVNIGVVSERKAVLPRFLRRPAMVTVALAVLGFGVLAARYAGGSKAGWFDGHVEHVVDALTPDQSRLVDMVILGNPLPVAAAAVALGGISLALGHRRLAALAIIGPGLTGVATEIFKPLIGRTILGGGFIYPSGHTGGATALGLVAALLLLNVLRPGARAGAVLVAAGSLLTGGAMAVALVVGGVHYPTDTAGGFCTAVAMVLGTALLLDRWADGPSRSAASHQPS